MLHFPPDCCLSLNNLNFSNVTFKVSNKNWRNSSFKDCLCPNMIKITSHNVKAIKKILSIIKICQKLFQKVTGDFVSCFCKNLKQNYWCFVFFLRKKHHLKIAEKKSFGSQSLVHEQNVFFE